MSARNALEVALSSLSEPVGARPDDCTRACAKPQGDLYPQTKTAGEMLAEATDGLRAMNDTTTDAANLLAPALEAQVADSRGRRPRRRRHLLLLQTQALRLPCEDAAVPRGAQRTVVGDPRQPRAKTTLSGRALADQVELINSSVVGLEARKRLRAETPPEPARRQGQGEGGREPLERLHHDHHRSAHAESAAMDLANMYATVYVERQRGNYQRAIKAAIANAKQQLRRLEAAATGQGRAPPARRRSRRRRSRARSTSSNRRSRAAPACSR